jgi:hypothetical protein
MRKQQIKDQTNHLHMTINHQIYHIVFMLSRQASIFELQTQHTTQKLKGF